MGTFEEIRLRAAAPQVRFGFPLFPEGTSIENPALPRTIGGGASANAPSRHQLIDDTVPLARWRLHANLKAEFFQFSFAGFSIDYIVSGVTRRAGIGDLRVRLDDTQGGAGFGISITLDTTIRLEEGTFRYDWGPFGGLGPESWEAVIDQSFSPNIDLIAVALTVFNLMTGGVLPLQEIRGAQTVGPSGAVWGLFDRRSNRYAADNRIQLRPSIDVHVNVLRAIPKVGTAIKVMAAVGLRVSQGPSFIFVFPITIRLVRFITVDGTYTVINEGGPIPGTVRLVNGPVTNTTPVITSAEAIHEHTVGFEFRFEIHSTISFLGLVSLGGSTPLPFRIFPQQPLPRGGRPLSTAFGPYYTRVSSEGATAQVELPDVIWG
jgi:hypothetical protein